jgi:hypothetical protein
MSRPLSIADRLRKHGANKWPNPEPQPRPRPSVLSARIRGLVPGSHNSAVAAPPSSTCCRNIMRKNSELPFWSTLGKTIPYPL